MLKCSVAFVAIAVDQWDAMVQFYGFVTGHSPQPHIPNVYAEFRIGDIRVGLFQPKSSHQQEFAAGRTAKVSICLEVDNLEQSQQVIDQAYSALNLPVSQAQPWLGAVAIASHGRECYAYDPDGNRLILHEAIR
ncbi:MAG: glyoxalase [Leptolyngbyaceae cyanobacterium]